MDFFTIQRKITDKGFAYIQDLTLNIKGHKRLFYKVVCKDSNTKQEQVEKLKQELKNHVVLCGYSQYAPELKFLAISASTKKTIFGE